MKENEPFYFHEGTDFIEGVRVEEYFDPAWLYNIDPTIGYFTAKLNAKTRSYWAPLVSCGEETLNPNYVSYFISSYCL